MVAMKRPFGQPCDTPLERLAKASLVSLTWRELQWWCYVAEYVSGYVEWALPCLTDTPANTTMLEMSTI